MTFLYRLTLGVAILNFLGTAVVALVYYVWVRPEWRDPAFARDVEATLLPAGQGVRQRPALAGQAHPVDDRVGVLGAGVEPREVGDHLTHP